MKWLSSRNLKYMKSLAEAYPDEPIVQEVLAQITWYHNITILDKVKDPVARDFYIRATIQHGWSRNILVHQIESGMYERQGRARGKRRHHRGVREDGPAQTGAQRVERRFGK